MIDMEKAKKAFDKYVKDNYDLNNESIKKVYNHILNVSKLSRDIIKNSNIMLVDAEDLAELIGLIHDIGSFKTINNNLDHVGEGLRILFDEKNIRKFISDAKYDEIIKSAIYNHNQLEVAPFVSDQEKLFIDVLRDADKIDILKTIAESNEVINQNEMINSEIINIIKSHKTISKNLITNKTEEGIYVLAYIFDIKYKYSFYNIEENSYLEKIAKRIHIDTNDTIRLIYNEIKTFITMKIGERYHAE